MRRRGQPRPAHLINLLNCEPGKMTAHHKIPYPLKTMLEHLEIDIEPAFELLPKEMQKGIKTCTRCKMFQRCDYFVESRYFQCPNRDLFDRLEDLLR